jgi:hypothetical protein
VVLLVACLLLRWPLPVWTEGTRRARTSLAIASRGLPREEVTTLVLLVACLTL